LPGFIDRRIIAYYRLRLQYTKPGFTMRLTIMIRFIWSVLLTLKNRLIHNYSSCMLA